MAEALHREVEELKGILDAAFEFMEASKVGWDESKQVHSAPM